MLCVFVNCNSWSETRRRRVRLHDEIMTSSSITTQNEQNKVYHSHTHHVGGQFVSSSVFRWSLGDAAGSFHDLWPRKNNVVDHNTADLWTQTLLLRGQCGHTCSGRHVGEVMSSQVKREVQSLRSIILVVYDLSSPTYITAKYNIQIITFRKWNSSGINEAYLFLSWSGLTPLKQLTTDTGMVI